MKALLAKLFGMFNQPEPQKPVEVAPVFEKKPAPVRKKRVPAKGVVAAKKTAAKKTPVKKAAVKKAKK